MLFYSIAVLVMVAWMGDIGVRCVFGTEVKEPIPTATSGRADGRGRGTAAGDRRTARSPITPTTSGRMRSIGQRVGQTGRRLVEGPATGRRGRPRRRSSYRPLGTYIWSLIWFLQEMLIFAVGGPGVLEAAARRLGAALLLALHRDGRRLHGGYHWTEIVVEPPLIYPFAAFAVFVPVVSLHFYLVFPRPNPVLAALSALGPGGAVRGPLGLPGRRSGGHALVAVARRPRRPRRACPALRLVRSLALGYIALAVVIFGLCILCLAPATARRGRGPSGTRSSGSCWPR